jgi:hypothetical protein
VAIARRLALGRLVSLTGGSAAYIALVEAKAAALAAEELTPDELDEAGRRRRRPGPGSAPSKRSRTCGPGGA